MMRPANYAIVLAILLIVLFSCKDDPKPQTPPEVVTGVIDDITENSAVVSGEVISDGNASVTERGVVLGLAAEPTTADTKIKEGAGTGQFSIEASGLGPGITYHVRAYAINSVATAYGMDKQFTTAAVLPSLTTSAVFEIRSGTAKSGGEITSDGGSAVTERGVCWGLNPNPTTADHKSVAGSGSGSFVVFMEGLVPEKKYYVRSFATNSRGTAYGEEVSFTTPRFSVVPLNGLIGWWPFNGNTEDESGNGNHASANKVTLSEDRNNIPNSAYLFGGGEGNISTTTTFFDGSKDFTINFWIKANSKNHGTVMNTAPHTIFGISLNPYYAPGGGEGRIGFAYGTGLDAGWLLNAYSYVNPKPFLDVWVNHAIVKSGLNWKFFQNGVLTHELLATAQPGSILSKMVFGNCDPAACNEAFNGVYDDISIYNRALTAEEVLRIFNGSGF